MWATDEGIKFDDGGTKYEAEAKLPDNHAYDTKIHQREVKKEWCKIFRTLTLRQVDE